MQEILLGDRSGKENTPIVESFEFIGEQPTTGFIDGVELASVIGLTQGVAINTNEPWLKFVLDGKTLFVAKKPLRHTVSWDQLNALGVMFGTSKVTIQGATYKVRSLKGAFTSPIATNGYDPMPTWGSEWNRLFYPLIPNPTQKPGSGVSGEGIVFGSAGTYTEQELGMGYYGGDGRANLCPEVNITGRAQRGYAGVTHIDTISSNLMQKYCGWRPVLELVE